MKSYKKFDEKAQTGKFTVFTIWNQLHDAKNTDFYGNENANYSKFSNTIPYPEGYHVKAYVPRIPKMWYFLGLAVFKVELLALKVRSNSKKKSRKKNVKKKTRPQF